ncbi:MAG: trypsin-like peptidase domain-containing protein [Oscillospiraceae bacterium]|jgi:serine protease Do|nr:trypsin-like peptidase domain-containing protein [Oscillospiraceae bacterium]
MPNRSNRLFFTAFIILLALIFIASGLLAAALNISGVAFVQFSDGTVMLGEWERAAAARPPVRPPVSIPAVTVPSVSPAWKEPGGTLTFSEIYKKNVQSVTVILSESQYGGGAGTGIVVSGDGYIVTNNHVVENAREITVILHNGVEYSARLIGADRISDLAVLKIRADGLSPAEFGNSDAMEHGDSVAAIGNPLGLELRSTITTGVISGVNRDITLEDSSGDITMTVLQTNCAVNPGNSGGPLLNQYGQVIGIISSKIMGSASQTVEGLGFAIPSNTAVPLVEQLIENGYIAGRPALGISVDTTYTEAVAQFYGLPAGVRVTGVNENSDAYTKGLQPNDIITHINGIAVAGIGEVNDIKNEHAAGDVLRLTVYRLGGTMTIDVMLMEEGSLR